MRRVEILRHDSTGIHSTDEFGMFHQFGVDYDEYTKGYPGSYSTAIVEMPDGTVKNLPTECIKFIGEKIDSSIEEAWGKAIQHRWRIQCPRCGELINPIAGEFIDIKKEE